MAGVGKTEAGKAINAIFNDQLKDVGKSIKTLKLKMKAAFHGSRILGTSFSNTDTYVVNPRDFIAKADAVCDQFGLPKMPPMLRLPLSMAPQLKCQSTAKFEVVARGGKCNDNMVGDAIEIVGDPQDLIVKHGIDIDADGKVDSDLFDIDGDGKSEKITCIQANALEQSITIVADSSRYSDKAIRLSVETLFFPITE